MPPDNNLLQTRRVCHTVDVLYTCVYIYWGLFVCSLFFHLNRLLFSGYALVELMYKAYFSAAQNV